MPGMSEEITIPIECPECGRKIEPRLVELKDDPLLICPGCGAQMQLNSAAAVRDAINRFDEIGQFLETLSKLAKPSE